MSERTISSRHALDESEFSFCKKVLAKLPAASAYRRVYYFEAPDGLTYESKDAYFKGMVDGVTVAKPVTSKEVSRRATALLSQDHIQSYIAELQNPAVDLARGTLLEQAVLEGNRQAAETILADDDKLGRMDAYEHWLMVMCAVNTEVVVPLPGGGEVAFPLKQMFPKYEDAMPPRDVVVKTIKSLEAYLERDQLATEEVAEEIDHA